MLLRALPSLTLLILSHFAASGTVSSEEQWMVVVHGDSAVSSLTQKQVMSLFLGRAKFLPSGERARALDFPVNSEARASFYQSLTGKNIADIDAYWARLQYSGRATPPLPVASSDQIIQLLSEEPSAIAYLPADMHPKLDEHGLKSVFIIDDNR